jgi:hypothetical protein
MRLVVCVLACVGAGGMSLALADPPATPTAPPATTQAPAATPATPAQPAAAASTPSTPAKAASSDAVVVQGAAEEDNLEKHFLAEGYKMEMHHGEKYFCRREEELGSRLGGQKYCSTAQQLDANEREAKAAVQRGNSQQNNVSGK